MSTKVPVTEPAPGVMTLVGEVKNDLTTLVKDQVALTKRELSETMGTVAKSSAVLAAAAFLAVLFVIFLLVTIAYVLVALGLPVWAGFGIVTLALLLVTAVLALVGIKRLKTVKGPERSLHQLAQTRALLAGSDETG
ncbi:MAG TPA: phage holin family protein [Candidatus Nanopelagicales bacterium]|jgi:hypothetical protein|nr:phage holin family protein [Candidatus Nanopelagicales bacterium]